MSEEKLNKKTKTVVRNKRVTALFPESVWRDFQTFCATQGISPNDFLNNAVMSVVNNNAELINKIKELSKTAKL